MRLRETIVPVPRRSTDKDKIVSYIQTLHKINKELWPRAGTAQDFSHLLEAAPTGLSHGTL